MVNYCPECGGEIQYISLTKHYVCKSCGLSCTGQELNDLHDKNRPADETAEEARQARRKEYLKWYLSKKQVRYCSGNDIFLALTMYPDFWEG